MTRALQPLRRHLLAVCTFLVPLGVLAWLGQSELRRQSGQVKTAFQREAVQFLASAKEALEQQFDRLLPEVATRATDLLAKNVPATATRKLRTDHGAVLDLVLLDEHGNVTYPEPAQLRPGLLFAHDPTPREPWEGHDHSFAARSAQETLQIADLLLTRGLHAEAEQLLLRSAKRFDEKSDGRSRGDGLDFQVATLFRLATVQQRLGKTAVALDNYQRARAQAKAVASQPRRSPDADSLACGLLAELAIAELTTDHGLRRDLLVQIAGGQRDQVADGQLLAVAQRAAAGVPGDAAERPDVAAALQDVAIHLHARAFAADYDSYQKERIRRRLHNRGESTEAVGEDLRQVFTLDGHSSILLLRSLPEGRRRNAAWVCIRLDLALLLAGTLERYVRGDGSFVLAIADSEDEPVVGAPRVPTGFEPPSQITNGLQLRAYPADVDTYQSDAGAAARNSMLLTAGLFVTMLIGALWLWRSVSRESELLALKVDLVSRVSHELKTPLALISLYGETLGMRRARDIEQAAQFGNIITRESERLTAMIQRILDFSRKEAGTLNYQATTTDLGVLLAEIATAYAPHLETKGSRLTTDLVPGAYAKVDRAALSGAIVNLLENAVKYSRDDLPDRDLRLELRSDGRRATIDVLDRGRGVPAAERHKVFDSFYRASNSGEVRGAGLGLNLVRHFAEAHGGSASALPRPGGGSIFRIHLPTTPTTP